MIKFFLYYTLFFGLILTICSFILTPKVKDTTDRAEKSANGIQVLGVALFCISATILLCGANIKDSSKKDIFLGLLILASGIVITTLASIVHTDCEDAKALSSVLIGFGVLSIVLSFVIFGLKFKNRKVSNSNYKNDGIEMVKQGGSEPAGAKTASGAGPTAVPAVAGVKPSAVPAGGTPAAVPAGPAGATTGAVPPGVAVPAGAPTSRRTVSTSGTGNTPVLQSIQELINKLSTEQKEKCASQLDNYKQCLLENASARASASSPGLGFGYSPNHGG